MINKEELETTEFYNHRFKNFATMTIMPGLLLLILGFLFLVFAKKEVTISSIGELTPSQSAVSVQSITTSKIIENHLKEGKVVKKGETLLTFHDVSSPAQLELLKSQIKNLKDQASALSQLREGLLKNADNFTKDDAFGYRQLLKDYLSQREVYALESDRIGAEQGIANQKSEKINQLTQDSINATQDTISAYQSLLSAIQSGSNYNGTKLSYLFENFKADRADLTGEALTKVRNTYVAQINQQLETLNANLDSLKIQQASALESDTSPDLIKENQSKLASLQATQLKSVDAQNNQLNQSLSEAQSKLVVLDDQSKDHTIKAPASGTLHLDSSLKGKEYVPSGTTLAEIYPNLASQKYVNLTLYVSPSEIESVHTGLKVRLRLTQNIPSPLILNGIITNIDVAPTVTKNGNIFQVTAAVPLTDNAKRSLYYGLGGRVSIVTGHKTYWKVLIDRLFNQA